jgi:hypothetical protein
VSTGDLPQMRQRDVGWLRPARQPGDGWRAVVQALQVPSEGLVGGADLRRSQVICMTGCHQPPAKSGMGGLAFLSVTSTPMSLAAVA